MKKVVSKKAPGAIGPYSQAIVAGGFVWVSGQLPLDPESGVMEVEVGRATERCIRNIEGILGEVGLGLGDVVRVEVFLKNMGDFGKMNEVYGKWFVSEMAPARQTVEVAGLPKGACVEISCVAWKGMERTLC